METETYGYPVPLGIAYIFLGGYILRSVFVTAGLPAAVGVILSGYLFQHFFQRDLFFARDEMQELAFFLVLLIAGLEIRIPDLTIRIFVMAWVPATLEVVGIAVYAMLGMEYALVESLVLATVLVALGDGLVIPKMKEFGQKFPNHPLPRLVFTWAPLEASFALTLFGILTGVASPANQPETPVSMIMFANLFRIAATVVCGVILGSATGYLIPRRAECKIAGMPVFNGSAVEGFLMVLAIELVAFALGKGEAGGEVVPMFFCPGSMFQPELLVIVTGTVFAYICKNKHELHEIENIMGQLWIFGQLVLFSMLGSKTTPGILPQVGHILPIMLCGLSMRFVGVFLGMIITTISYDGCVGFNLGHCCADTLFCFLCTLPRASIQGALGAVPLKQGFFHRGYSNNQDVQAFIFTAARLYIVLTSIVGMILLNTVGGWLLESSAERHSYRTVQTPSRSRPSVEDDGLASAVVCDGRNEAVLLAEFAARFNIKVLDLKDFLHKADSQQIFHGPQSAQTPLLQSPKPPARHGERLLEISDPSQRSATPPDNPSYDLPVPLWRKQWSDSEGTGLNVFESTASSLASVSRHTYSLQELDGSKSTVSCQVLQRDPRPDDIWAFAAPPQDLHVRVPDGYDFQRDQLIPVAFPHGEQRVKLPPKPKNGDWTYRLGPKPDFKATIPAGVLPGGKMQFHRKDGLSIFVPVPKDLGPGDSFFVTPPSLMVRVPERVRSGDLVIFKNPAEAKAAELGKAGKAVVYRARVPEKIRSDGYFAVRLPVPRYDSQPLFEDASKPASCCEYVCRLLDDCWAWDE
eukprot:TRINITY_DN89226_c0_g1_i1.p1 TRINITY_DN89226_c0_g1~~TRINITY_DN89226_c0_g1_i1.p1  ORF type:complete len:815 (-),score=125.67 TRINITY_DN89226_c0_g1_i1:191-2605(-)